MGFFKRSRTVRTQPGWRWPRGRRPARNASRQNELRFDWKVTELERRLMFAADMVTADFNNDRFLDVAQVDAAAGTVNLFMGSESGQFAAPQQLPIGTGGTPPDWQPAAIATGDFNNDGRPDLAVANLGNGVGEDRIEVFLNINNSFEYDAARSFVVTGGLADPRSLVVGDFNGDGLDDLAVLGHDHAGSTVFPPPTDLLDPQIYRAHGAIGDSEDPNNPDVDSFSIELAHNPSVRQTIAIAVSPGEGLTPGLRVEVTPHAGATAEVIGTERRIGDTLYWVADVDTAGKYEIHVSGGETTGTFELELLLTAAFENEQRGGESNDLANGSQNIDGDFINASDGVARATIFGVGDLLASNTVNSFVARFDDGLDGFVINNTAGSGNGLWHFSTGRSADSDPNHSRPGSLYFGKGEGPAGGGNYEVAVGGVPVAVGGTALSPLISLPNGTASTLRFQSLIQVEPNFEDLVVNVVDGLNRTPLMATLDGSMPIDTAGTWQPFVVDLAPFAGRQIQLEFSFETGDSAVNAFEGWYIDDIVVSSTIIAHTDADWYQLTLADGDLAEVAARSLTQSLLQFELYAADGTTLLATGTSLDPTTIYAGFIDSTTDDSLNTYYVRVVAGGEYRLDVAVTDRADTRTPFTALQPFGSLIYASELQGSIRALDDTSNFSFGLDGGQLISIVVDAATTLQPTIEIWRQSSTGDVLVASHSATEAGGIANVHSVHVAEAGMYRLAVHGASGTIGAYTGRILLNTAVEIELPIDGIQDIDSTFNPIGIDGADRAAVLGSLDDSHRFDATITRFDVFTPGNPIAFDFSSLDRPVAAIGQATLTIAAVGNLAGAELSIAGRTFVLRESEIQRQPSDPRSWWSTEIDPRTLATLFNVADAIQIVSNAGVGSGLNGVTMTLSYEHAAGAAAPQSTTFDTDTYRFTLGASESASLLLTPTSAAGNAALWLADAQGNYLAAGVATDDGQLRIDGFAHTGDSPQEFRIIVTGSEAASYSLLVTRDAQIELEPNNPADSPQSLPSSGTVMGHLQGADRVFAVLPFENAIVELNPTNGEEINRFATPIATIDQVGPEGLAFDGSSLYFVHGGATLYELDADTGQLIDTTEIIDPLLPGYVPFFNAVAVVNDSLAAYDLQSQTIYFVNPLTGVATAGWSGSTGFPLRGMAGSSTRNSIFISDGFSAIYEHDAANGEIKNAFILLDPPGSQIFGLAYARGQIYAGLTDGSVHKINPDTGESLFQFALNSPITALGGDEAAGAVPGDFYRLVADSDVVTLSVVAPASGQLEPVNTLIPHVAVFDADGNPVDIVVSNSGSVEFAAEVGQEYTVGVSAQSSTQGEYVLRVIGAADELRPLAVTGFEFPATLRQAGNRVSGAPDEVTIHFSNGLQLASLRPEHVTVDGVAATHLRVIDGNSIAFRFGGAIALSEGTHTLVVAEFTDSLGQTHQLADLHGRPLEGFSTPFTIDLTPPRVIAGSFPDVVEAGLAGSLRVEFSEAIAAGIDVTDLRLDGVQSGRVDPSLLSIAVDPAAPNELVIHYLGLPEDIYTLTLFSGDGQFEDIVGHDLDGDADGIAGGNFVRSFSADRSGAVSLQAVREPLPGSLIYGTVSLGLPVPVGVIGAAHDTDFFEFALDAGQTMTVVIPVSSASLRPELQIQRVDSTGAVVDSQTFVADSAGADLFVQTVHVAESGTYRLVVGGADETTGAYSIRVVLNAAVEGPPSDAPQNIDASFIPLAQDGDFEFDQGEAARGAVLGSGDSFTSDWYRFTLGAGESATLAANLLLGGDLQLALFDGNGTTQLAVPRSYADGSLRIVELVNTTGEQATYLARLDGFGLYSLVVTRNAEFELEPNGNSAAAQDISRSGTVLGWFGEGQADPPGVRVPVGLPQSFVDGKGFNWNIFFDGAAISTGGFDRGLELFGFGFSPVAQLEDGRELVIGPQPQGDVEVSRKIFVSPDQGFARYLEIVTNVSSVETTYFLSVSSDLRASLPFSTIWTSSGDPFLATDDNWLIVDDPFIGLPAVLQVLAGEGGQRPAFAALESFDFTRFDYELTLQPGETQIVMHFASQGADFASAAAIGSQLADLQLGALTGMSSQELEQVVNFATGASDQYVVSAAAGDVLTIRATTPGGGPNEFVNTLEPVVALIDPSGQLVLPDDQGNYAISTSGNHIVRITGANSSFGEYVLQVTGATSTEAPFIASIPDLAATLPTAPAQLVVELSDDVLLTSIDAGDLFIDLGGEILTATNVQVIDANTLAFDLPELQPGDLTVRIEEGALVNLQGQGLRAFSQNFEISPPPRVIASSISQDSVHAAGTLTYVAEFDIPLNATALDAEDFSLVGANTGAYTPQAFTYDLGSSTLTITYANLPEDRYTLTLFSGNGRFESAEGADLDGERQEVTTVPSGDGLPGGNFILQFSTDFDNADFPTPLTPLLPVGSSIYVGTASGVIGAPGDNDRFMIDLDDGQTATIVFDPTAELLAEVRFLDPSGNIIATLQPEDGLFTAPMRLESGGTHTLEVIGAGETTGAYSLRLLLNAAVETESHGGPANDSRDTAQEIDSVFANLDGSAVPGAPDRAAVIGRLGLPQSSPGETFGYFASAVPFQFIDIGGSGSVLNELTNVDDSAATVPIGFSFNFYGTSYTSLSVSSNGLITFGTANADYFNSDLTLSPEQAAIAPLWDDLVVQNNFNSASVRYQIVGTEGNRQLIIQWDDVRYIGGFGDDTITFQAVLSEATDSIEFNYLDLSDLTISQNEASSATVGVKAAGFDTSRLLVSYFDEVSTLVGSGRSLRIELSNPEPDYYSFSLDAGASASIVATTQGAGSLSLELHDAAGNVLETGQNGSSIHDFVAPESGTYYVRVAGGRSADYSLVILRDAVFESEPNGIPANAQDISASGVVVGSIDPPTVPPGLRQSITLPRELFDGTGFRWDIGSTGFIQDGTNDAYDFGLVHQGFANPSFAGQLEDSREVVIGPQSIGGLEVSRKIYVPTDQGFARYLEIVTNTSAEVANYALTVNANLGSDSSTVLVATSSGNPLTTADNWLITDDATNGDGDPTLLHVFAGAGGQRPNSVSRNADAISFTYNLTLQPGETQIVMHFASQNTNQATALVKGPQLANLELGALAGMTPQELSQVVNFDAQSGEADYYLVTVNEGDVLSIRTRTTAAGPYEFANALHPVVALFDPDGQLVQANDHGAPDGHNALLQHTAALAGNYLVRVTGAGGTFGEYVLEVTGASGEPLSIATALASEFSSSLSTDAQPTTITDNAQPMWLVSAETALDQQAHQAERNEIAISGLLTTLSTEVNGRDVLIYLQRANGAGFESENPIRVGTHFDSGATLVADDFNADGRTDLAMLGIRSGHLIAQTALLLESSDARLSLQVSSREFAASTITTQPLVVTGDFNNDGAVDLSLLDGALNPNLEQLLGNGDGQFRHQIVTTLAGLQADAMVASYFDSDSLLDIAILDPTNKQLLIHFGSKVQDLQPTGDAPAGLVAGDFDQDGRGGIAVGRDPIATLAHINFGAPNANPALRPIDLPDVAVVEDSGAIIVDFTTNSSVTLQARSSANSLIADQTTIGTTGGTSHSLTITPQANASGVATITLTPVDDPLTTFDESTIVLARFQVIVRAQVDTITLDVRDLTGLATDPPRFSIQASLTDDSESRHVELIGVPEESTIANSAGQAAPRHNGLVQIPNEWFAGGDTIELMVLSPPVSREFSFIVSATSIEPATGAKQTQTQTIAFDAGNTAPSAVNLDVSSGNVVLTGSINAADVDVFRILDAPAGSIVKISVRSADSGSFTPRLRLLDGAGQRLHDADAFAETGAFRIDELGDYFLEVSAPHASGQEAYEIQIEIVAETAATGVVVVPVANSGVSFRANAGVLYQLKLDNSQVFELTVADPTANNAALQVFAGIPNVSGKLFASGSESAPFQVAFDKDGTYYLQVNVDSTVSLALPAGGVAGSDAAAAVLSVDSPLELPISGAIGVDWYRVALQPATNIRVSLAAGQAGLTLEVLGPEEARRRFMPAGSTEVSAPPDAVWDLYIRVDTTNPAIAGNYTLRVERFDQFNVGSAPAEAVAIDFDNDGTLDAVAVINELSDTVSILRSRQDGTFVEQIVSLRTGSTVADHELPPTLKGPVSLIAADLNGDSVVDLAIVNSLSRTISVLLWTGEINGELTFQSQEINLPVVGTPVAIQSGRFDQDQFVDLAIVDRDTNTVTILLGNGAGGFTPATAGPIAVGEAPGAIVTGHFNGDEYLDIGTLNANSVSILFGTGDGRFPLEYRHEITDPLLDSAVPEAIFVSDKNIANDNFTDFVVRMSNGALYWLEQASVPGTTPRRGGYYFDIAANPISIPDGFQAIALVDIAGSIDSSGSHQPDGIPDLVLKSTANVGNDPELYEIRILVGAGDGAFVPLERPADSRPAVIRLSAPAASGFSLIAATAQSSFPTVVIADINNDRIIDVLFVDSAGGVVRPYIGDGQGGFRTVGVPVENVPTAPSISQAPQLEFPELLFAQSAPAQRAETIRLQLAGAQSVRGGGGGASSAGRIPTDDAELSFEFDETLPQTDLEGVGLVAVDVLEINEAAFEPPAAPWDVSQLIPPVKLAVFDSQSDADAGTTDDDAAPAGRVDHAKPGAVTPAAGEAGDSWNERAGWLAGATALVAAPLLYWLAKSRLFVNRKKS